MTHTATLLHRTVKPHIAEMAGAIQQDAAALAAEWSVGSDLSMISAKSVASENVARILLLASAAALKDAGDGTMAQLVEAYLAGRRVEMQFAHRNWQTECDLDAAAADAEALADELVTRFRAAVLEVAA